MQALPTSWLSGFASICPLYIVDPGALKMLWKNSKPRLKFSFFDLYYCWNVHIYTVLSIEEGNIPSSFSMLAKQTGKKTHSGWPSIKVWWMQLLSWVHCWGACWKALLAHTWTAECFCSVKAGCVLWPTFIHGAHSYQQDMQNWDRICSKDSHCRYYRAPVWCLKCCH